MRIGVIIPDRNDRPELLANCLRMMKRQTVQPVGIALINFPPTSNEKDITTRYRVGYSKWSASSCDVIALVENDDYYAPTYLEKMYNGWVAANKPDIFGTDQTIYYNLNERAYKFMSHKHRSSAMSTFIKPDLAINWPVDNDPYTDISLWRQLVGVTKTFMPFICVGIKHGTGLCGGRMHTDRLELLTNKDPDLNYLRSIMDEESFEFYTK